MTLTPAPSAEKVSTGAFDEEVRAVTITVPHTRLVIESHSKVDVHTPPIAFAFDTPWESVRAHALALRFLDANGPASFLYPTARAPIVAAITDYVRLSFSPGRPIIEAASELMGRIHADFRYDPGATDVRRRRRPPSRPATVSARTSPTS